jgi:hypothetical protein
MTVASAAGIGCKPACLWTLSHARKKPPWAYVAAPAMYVHVRLCSHSPTLALFSSNSSHRPFPAPTPDPTLHMMVQPAHRQRNQAAWPGAPVHPDYFTHG